MTHTPTPCPANPGPGQPPPGWFPFGTHADRPDLLVVLSWTHLGDDGLPMWERPIITCTCDGHDHTPGRHGCGVEIVPGRAWCPCDANPTTTQTTQENP